MNPIVERMKREEAADELEAIADKLEKMETNWRIAKGIKSALVRLARLYAEMLREDD